MKTGLYKVEFRTPRGNGAGVVIIEGGKFRGGDGAFYYFGDYQESGGHATATVEVKRHTQGGVALLGEHATINLQGAVSGETAALTGTVVGMPGIKFEAHLKYLVG